VDFGSISKYDYGADEIFWWFARFSETPAPIQPLYKHFPIPMRTQPTTTQPRATPNHLLRVESKNDSDSTIHIRDPPTPTQPCINKKRRGKSATALLLAYGSGDMRLFQRTAQKQSFRSPTQILAV